MSYRKQLTLLPPARCWWLASLSYTCLILHVQIVYRFGAVETPDHVNHSDSFTNRADVTLQVGTQISRSQSIEKLEDITRYEA